VITPAPNEASPVDAIDESPTRPEEEVPVNSTLTEAPVENPTRKLQALDFTLSFGPQPQPGTRGRRHLQTLSMDRAELYRITEQHLLETFQAELGKDVVVEIQLILTNLHVSMDPDGASLVTEQASGVVVFLTANAIPRSDTMDEIARQSFQGNGLGLYLFRLQIADDPALKRVQQVWLGTVADQPGLDSSNQNQQQETNSSIDWGSSTMLAIVASVAATIVAVCVVSLLLVCRHTSTAKSDNHKQRQVQEDDDPLSKQVAPIPHVVTKTSDSDSESSPMTYDPHMLSPSSNQVDDQHAQEEEEDDEDLENQSAMSMYSYAVQDDASLSVAPSFLYSIHEADQHQQRNDDAMDMSIAGTLDMSMGPESPVPQKKKSKWNVVETLNSQFRSSGETDKSLSNDTFTSTDSDQDDYHRAYHHNGSRDPPKILGILGGESESESGASNSLVYDDHSLVSDLGGGTLRILQMEDDRERQHEQQTTTPKKSFEDLWGDEKEAPPPSSQIKTVKKSNKGRDAARALGSSITSAKKSSSSPDNRSETGIGKHSKSSRNSGKEVPTRASAGYSFETNDDDASMLGKVVDYEDDHHPDDQSMVSYISMESDSSNSNRNARAMLLPDQKSRGSFQPASAAFHHQPTPVSGQENDHPNRNLDTNNTPKSVRKIKSTLSSWSARDTHASAQVKPTDSTKLQSLLDRADKTPTKPTLSFEQAWKKGESESPVFQESRLQAAPPPNTSYEDAWLAGASQIHKHGAATTSQSSKNSSKDFDQELDLTLDTSGSVLKDSVTRNLPNQQPQETTVMHMSIPDSEATTIDNSHSLSGIKISSLINSFDNAWGADPANKTQSMLHADSSSDDGECYMEDDNAILDQSTDYSLDSDINASQPDDAPLENLLDSSFPDMAVDDDPEMYFNNQEDDNEHVLHGQASETREKELEASVQGSEYSNDEATNMTAQLSLLLGDNSVQAPNLRTVDKETNKANRDESAVNQNQDEIAVEQNQDEIAVEQQADPAGPQISILEQDLGTADHDASVLAQAVSRDNQDEPTMKSDDQDDAYLEQHVSAGDEQASTPAQETDDKEKLCLEQDAIESDDQASTPEQVMELPTEVKVLEQEMNSLDQKVNAVKQEVETADQEIDDPVPEAITAEQETTTAEPEVMELPAEEVKVLDQDTTTLEQEGTPVHQNVDTADQEINTLEPETITVEQETTLADSDMLEPPVKEVEVLEQDTTTLEQEGTPVHQEVDTTDQEIDDLEPEAITVEQETTMADPDMLEPPVKEVEVLEQDTTTLEQEGTPVHQEVDTADQEIDDLEPETMTVEQETTTVEPHVMELPAEEVKVLEQDTTILEQEGPHVHQEVDTEDQEIDDLEPETITVEQETTTVEPDVMELPAEEAKVLEQETTILEQEGTPVQQEADTVDEELRAFEPEAIMVEQDTTTVEHDVMKSPVEEDTVLQQETPTLDQEASTLQQEVDTVDEESNALGPATVMVESETIVVEDDTTSPQEDSAQSNVSSDSDRGSHHEEEKKEDLSVGSFRSDKELCPAPLQEEEIIPKDDDGMDSIMMSGIAQFLDSKQTRTSPGDDSSVDMSVTSDATFRLGRHMGKF
jgi:hypothetical protein